MAPLYWAPAIVYGAVRYYLPPMLTLKDSWSQDLEIISPPYESSAKIVEVNDNQPVRLTLEARSKFDVCTQRAVLDWMNEVRTHLRGKTFALYLFHDRGYAKCALDSADLDIPLSPLVNRAISMNIVAEDYQTTELETLTFAGGYDNDYPYAAYVGRPKGDAVDGGSVIAMQTSYQTPSGHFGGIPDITLAGGEQVIIVGGTTGSQWQLEAVQITAAEDLDSPDGPTTVEVGTAPLGQTGPALSATVAANERFSELSSQSPIQVTAGSKLYVRVTAAGGHNDVQYVVRIKAL